MKVSIHTTGEVVVVSLVGDLDSSTAPEVQEQLRTLIEPNGRVLLDLSRVPYMSSAGLRTILLVYRQSQSVNNTVGLVGVSLDLRRMMSATGFLGFFTLSDTVADGVRDLEATVRGTAS